jgi:hypothetical protein
MAKNPKSESAWPYRESVLRRGEDITPKAREQSVKDLAHVQEIHDRAFGPSRSEKLRNEE